MNGKRWTWSKRLTALSLAFVMLLSMLPLSVFVRAEMGGATLTFDSDLTGWKTAETAAAYNADAGHNAPGSMHIASTGVATPVAVMMSLSYMLPVTGGAEYAWGMWYQSRASRGIVQLDVVAYSDEYTAINTNADSTPATSLEGRSAMLSHGDVYSDWAKLVTYATMPAEAKYVRLKVVFSDGGPVDINIDDMFCDIINENEDIERTVDYADTLSLAEPHRIKTLLTGYTYRMTGTASSLPLTLKFYNMADEEQEAETLTIAELPVEFECPPSTYAELSGGGDIGGYAITRIANKPLTDTGWQAHSIWHPDGVIDNDNRYGHYYFFRTKITLDGEKVKAGGNKIKSFNLQIVAKDTVRSITFANVAVGIDATKEANVQYIQTNEETGKEIFRWERTEADNKRGGWAMDLAPRLNNNLFTNSNWTDGYNYVLAISASNVTAAAGLIFQGEVVYMDGTVLEVKSGVTHETLVYDGGLDDGTPLASNPPADDANEYKWTAWNYDDSAWMKAADQGTIPNAQISSGVFNTAYSARYTLTPSDRPTVTATGGKEVSTTIGYSSDFLRQLRKTDLTGHVYKDDMLVVSVPVATVFDDDAQTVKFTFTVPNYVGTGTYDLRLSEDEIMLMNGEVEDSTLCTLNLTQPTVSQAVSKVAADSTGTVYLTINGERTSPVLYLQPSGTRYSYDKSVSMQDSGVTLYTCFEGGLTGGIWTESGVDLDLVDEQIYKVLNTNPNAYLLYNITVDAPDWWKTANPDEVYVITPYDSSITEEVTTVSFASTKYREDCGAVIQTIAAHIAEAPYKNRVVGIRLSGGRTAEWMHEVVTESDGSTHQVDLSEPMLDAFNVLLTDKGLGTVDADALKTILADESNYGMLLNLSDDTTNGEIALLYNEYLSQTVSDTILYFAEQIKTASANLLTGAYNGYSWSANSAGVGAGHSTVNLLLESEYIDYISSPANYSERITGYKTGYMALADSVKAHGKLYIVEQDNRTVYMTEIADDGSTDSVGHTDTVYDGVHQLWRDFATNLVNGVGFWGYDMLGGWYNDPAFTELFARTKQAYDESLSVDTRSNSEVAVWVANDNFDVMVNSSFSADENESTQSYALFKQLHVDMRRELAKLGTSYDVFAIEDVDGVLTADQLSQYKVHLVLSPFQLTTAERAAMDEKLKVNGNTVVWVYLPGFSQDGGAWDGTAIESLTGITIGSLDKVSKISATNGTAIGTAPVPAVTYGGSAEAAPRAVIADESAITLATYTTDSAVSAAYKEINDGTLNYTSVYSAAPHVPVELLRAICQDAGVHIYTDDPDLIVETNASYIAVNTLTAGTKTITLPTATTMRDVLTGKEYTGTTYTLDMDAADTVLLAEVQPTDDWDPGLIPNGSFESNTLGDTTESDPTKAIGWIYGATGNLERTYEKAYEGWYSLKATTPFSARTSRISVEPNSLYTLTFQHMGGSADYTHTVRAQCYNAEGSALYASYSAYVWSGSATDDWEEITVSFMTTDNTAFVDILFNAQTGKTDAVSGVSYWDNFSLKAVVHTHEDTDEDGLCDYELPTYRALQENTTAQSATVPAGECGYAMEPAVFTNSWMTLGEELKLHLSVEVNKKDPETLSVRLEGDLPEHSLQTETELPLTEEQIDANGDYYVTVKIPAAHMHKTFTAAIYENGVRVEDGEKPTITFSAQQYAEAVIAGSDYSDAVKDVAKSMLNYGAWAQMYFGVDRSTLANAGLDDADRQDSEDFDTFYDKIVGLGWESDDDEMDFIPSFGGTETDPIDDYLSAKQDANKLVYGYSMLLQDRFGLRVYLNTTDTDIVSVSLDGGTAEGVTYAEDVGKYYYEVYIAAADLTDGHTLTISVTGADASESTAVVTNLGLLSVARSATRSSKVNYKNLGLALILYAEAVDALQAQ